MAMKLVTGRLLPSGSTQCQHCLHYPRCLSQGLGEKGQAAFEALLEHPRPLKRGEALVRQGGRFHNLYTVRTGSLKRVVSQAGMRDQVTHFFLPGEVVGLDCIGGGEYAGNLVALESTFVCQLPYSRLEALMQESPALRTHLFSSMCKEMRSDQRMMCLLSGRTADQRLASFFMDFSERFRTLGYSPSCFNLTMSRCDIGSYLGLAIETVSRVLGRFQKRKWIALEGRQVSLLELDELKQLSEEGCGRHSGF